jgi:mRNA-degrading endonuclease RelE of RelBE toxin-antitoxin system
MTYNVFVTYEIKEFFRYLDSKTSRIIKQNLKKLEQNPYPGKGTGDKERLPIQGKQRYRMHIGRTWTVFYSIIEEKKQVRISEIILIDDAHKKYGF